MERLSGYEKVVLVDALTSGTVPVGTVLKLGPADLPTRHAGSSHDVDLPTATGAHYRADHGPKKDADHTGLGIVRHRGWISIVDITATESDYPSAWTRKAVRRIAATF